jgi:Arc/MetJ-type ribon-helix-helix transcriptional regulator
MTITLRPELEEAIAQAMRSGSYKSPEEVIGRALEILRSEDQWLLDQKDDIANKIERAMAQFERGECFSAEESRVDMERRKAAWLARES